MSTLVRPKLHTVPTPVTLDVSDPHRTLTFLAWLRDRHTESADVHWRAVVDPLLDTTLLYHLPPPQPVPDGQEPEAVRRWRAAHRPALCYYRRGPGFIQIKDVRQAQTAARFLLDEPPLIDAFTRCLQPCRPSDLPPAERIAAQSLAAERLLFRLGDWAMTLPSRMRRWPVPSQFV